MKTVKINLYSYSELNPKAKEKAREWFLSDCPDLSHITDEAEQFLSFFGFSDVKIHWKGFCSQGDGACFIGNFDSSRLSPGKVTEFAPKDEELKRIDGLIPKICSEYSNVTAKLTHRGAYYHENSVDFDITFLDEEGYEASWNEKTERDFKELKEAFRDLMRWLYKSLETEYDYQTSEEVVTEITGIHYGVIAQNSLDSEAFQQVFDEATDLNHENFIDETKDEIRGLLNDKVSSRRLEGLVEDVFDTIQDDINEGYFGEKTLGSSRMMNIR